MTRRLVEFVAVGPLISK